MQLRGQRDREDTRVDLYARGSIPLLNIEFLMDLGLSAPCGS